MALLSLATCTFSPSLVYLHGLGTRLQIRSPTGSA